MKFTALLVLIPLLGGAIAAPEAEVQELDALPNLEASDAEGVLMTLANNARCPPSHPLYCRRYRFCCPRGAVSCCPKACCARGTQFCGANGHCYRRG
ncbi:hypothetical protein FQN49_002154 [Arthroderma sp. PD_2]|nr:hypothetical protein FQN49_002154 [Arthroderma sp. PD_2]